MSETTVKSEKTFDLPDSFIKRVQAWESSDSATEAAEKVGLFYPEGKKDKKGNDISGQPNASAMSAWSSVTRTERGIKLKMMTRGRAGSAKVDTDKANAYIETLRKQLAEGQIRNTPLEEAVARKEEEKQAA